MRSTICAVLIGMSLTSGAMAQEVLSGKDVSRTLAESGYNEIRIKKALEGKTIRLTGKVTMVDTIQVVIDADTPLMAFCMFDRSQVSKAEQLNVGDPITVVGDFARTYGGSQYMYVITMKPCRM